MRVLALESNVTFALRSRPSSVRVPLARSLSSAGRVVGSGLDFSIYHFSFGDKISPDMIGYLLVFLPVVIGTVEN